MAGCFGLAEDHCHVRVPPHRFVENRSRLDSFWLSRQGALVKGAETEVQVGPVGYRLAARGLNLLVNGVPIGLDETDWNLRWFVCACGRRCRFLYLPELACRRCCKLDWSSRHQHCSVPGLARLKWLRQRIGADPKPFTPIPRRQRHHLRYNRIVDDIRTLEAQLVGHLTELNRVLERRIRVRKAKGEW